MKNLYEHLSDLARAHPTNPALLACDARGKITKEITRAELLEKVGRAAVFLYGLGLRAGDKVVLEFSNCTDLLILSWAAWSTGIVTVPLDTKRDTGELREYKMRTSGAKRLISEETYSENVNVTDPPPWLPGMAHEALILFTSGTTARPKGAQLSLENIVVNAEGIIDWLRIREDDRFLVELPLHHINSTTFCLASLIAGASIAILPGYSNSRFWEQVAESRATLTSVVPSIIFDQLSRAKEFDAVRDRLKLARIQLGSAPVVASDALTFMRQFSVPLYQGYGQTETALRVTGMPMDLPKHLREELVAANSIGTPMRWAHVEIADGGGNLLGEKEQGELIVKGPAVMKGYVGGEPAFRNGYFLTGDVGYWKEIQGKRFFFLIGRSKEIIIKGGVNISPVAVEDALKRISADLEQAYVIGVPDERYGEEVGAVLVWRDGIDPAQALRRLKLSLLAGHELLSAYEVPKYFSTMRSEELPMTSTGKVQRTVLKKTLEGNMGPLYELMRSDEFRFVAVAAQSPFAKASHDLYNHCWQPLIKNSDEYRAYLGEYVTLGAVDIGGKLAGQISFSYDGKNISCVSICSATFKPKPVTEVKEIPDSNMVRQYLLAGHDPVMNFHHALGAKLVEVTPAGRPADKSSLGYTMLLAYPPVHISKIHGPVSNQLIQAVRLLAEDVDARVYAISRPGGLAAFCAKASDRRYQ